MERIDVVRKRDLTAGHSTSGITREKAFEDEDAIVSRSRVASAVSSDWHHHGTRRLYGFLVSGRLRLEYGLNGREAVDLEPGDFFHVPPALVHRDVNPDSQQPLEIVNILLGEGPAVVHVRGPSG